MEPESPYSRPYQPRSTGDLGEVLRRQREEDEQYRRGMGARQSQADMLRLGGTAASAIPYVGPAIAGVANQFADMRTRQDQQKAAEDAAKMQHLQFLLSMARR